MVPWVPVTRVYVGRCRPRCLESRRGEKDGGGEEAGRGRDVFFFGAREVVPPQDSQRGRNRRICGSRSTLPTASFPGSSLHREMLRSASTIPSMLSTMLSITRFP